MANLDWIDGNRAADCQDFGSIRIHSRVVGAVAMQKIHGDRDIVREDHRILGAPKALELRQAVLARPHPMTRHLCFLAGRNGSARWVFLRRPTNHAFVVRLCSGSVFFPFLFPMLDILFESQSFEVL